MPIWNHRSVKGWKKSRRDPPEGYGKSTSDYKQKKTPDGEKEYLLVDGYNIIFAWEDLKELAAVNIDGAREKLMDILCNYQGFKKSTLPRPVQMSRSKVIRTLPGA